MSNRLATVGAALVLVGCVAPPSATPSDSPVAPSSAAASVSSGATPTATQSAESSAPQPLAWEPLDAAGPAAREDHTWTLAGDGRTAFLFGGRDGGTAFDDLWSFDLASDTWARIDAEAGPAARFGHEAAWVDDLGLVVFAGQAGATFFNDLWAFDPSAGSWRELPAGGDVPVARYGSCAAIGPDGRLWISHGFTTDGTRFSDTRAYDFAAGEWTDETPAEARPVERCLHGCWWTDDGRLALYAGQTTGVTALGDRWLLADGAWSMVDGVLPPERNLYARSRIDGATLIFGGQALDGSFLADLWLLADGEPDASRLEADDPPPARAGAEMVTDAERGRALLFGGRNDDGALADVWQLRGSPLSGG
jgi:hypothetical protein